MDSRLHMAKLKPPTGLSSSSYLRREAPSHGKQLGNAQLLFEPLPPQQPREKTCNTRSPSPNVKRRVQSAKTSLTQQKATASQRRPRSAVIPGEKKPSRGHEDIQLQTSRKHHYVPVPKQFLNFEDNATALSQTHACSNDRRVLTASNQTRTELHLQEHSRVPFVKSENKLAKERAECDDSVPIPQGISALRPWLTQNIPHEWIGVDPSSCLVFLPSLLNETESLPIVPPPHGPSDVLPHKPAPPQPKPFDPKKLFHYDVEKNLPAHMKTPDLSHHRSRPGTGRAGRIYSLEGQVLHDKSSYGRHRTIEVVRQEIEDLELLLQGIGRKGSSNPVAQYQYEINMLRNAVRDTIIDCQLRRRPEPEEEEPPDLTGLREYIRERAQVLTRIKARREACIEELEKLETSLGLTPSFSTTS